MAAPSNPTGQPKYALGNSSDGLRNVLVAHAASGHQVFPRISASDGLRIVLPAPSATASAFDGLVNTPSAPASTSAESSSGMKHPPYDVFINHYGEDTKDTIAKSIYKKLDATGLRVFLDKDELELGDFLPETLVEAMASASLHIALFSEHYAHSPWCLAELAFMLPTRVTFIPIFYHVEPYTLRWTVGGKGAYADALLEHERKGRYSSEKLRSWNSALHEASFYTGEIINNQSDEEKAVMNVVNRVLKELKRVSLDVAKHAVGLDEVQQDFHNNIALQFAAGPVQIVGIYGMGGAGKTTLAKQLYNKKRSTFKKSSFVSDIREAARNKLLHEKQMELVKNLDSKGKGAVIDNIDEGKEILKIHLRSDSLLIVLDDVDHPDQLDALLPARESLGNGSFIIVTTRELRVLRGGGIFTMYKMRTLNPAHAQQLFCWHAFGQPSPFLGFEGLVTSFIKACLGLPLLLKVFGGLLYGESSKYYWQSQLHQLSRIVSEDIQLRLKISYDALDEEEKEIFLDVACFFIGWTSSRAIAVWDGSGWNGLHGWQRLVNKRLVEVDEEMNLIRMHDHVRDLGRVIANQQSPYRLWSKQQIIKIQPRQGELKIRGMAYAFGDNCYIRQGQIIINTNQGERSIQFRSLGLKIFIGNGDFINEEHIEQSRQLVCFRCHGFQYKNLPLFLLKNLRILELINPWRLEHLWEGDTYDYLQLRELIISKAEKLEKIYSLERLESLETFKIYDCSKLIGLPRLRLFSLKEFELKNCSKLEKIESLETSSLVMLKIQECSELNGLPNLTKLTSLKRFELMRCDKLEKIDSLEWLTSLETLSICSCPELSTLSSVANLISLKRFELIGCYKLLKIYSLENLRSLETLSICSCPKLITLPSLAELTFLKQFELKNCSKLKKIEGLESLSSLNMLKIQDCPELDGLPSLGGLISLKRFELIGCYKLEKIDSLESLRSLQTLNICSCPELILPSFVELTFLKEIELENCNKLEKIEGLKSLKSLEMLKIDSCSELDGLPNLAELTSLKKFELMKCPKLESIEGLESLKSLEVLRIDVYPKLDAIPSVVELISQKQIERNKNIDDCTELDGLPSLWRINFSEV